MVGIWRCELRNRLATAVVPSFRIGVVLVYESDALQTIPQSSVEMAITLTTLAIATAGGVHPFSKSPMGLAGMAPPR
jgi:hypothetical protein